MAFVPRIKKYLPKSELVHGTYYLGDCRNAEVARWNGHTQKFVYMRRKFDFVYEESIEHPEDFEGTDVFYPQKVCEVMEPHQIVTEGFEDIAEEDRANQDRFDALPQAKQNELNELYCELSAESESTCDWGSFLATHLPENDSGV